MQYNISTKDDLIEIAQCAIEQHKWILAIKIIETIQTMERNGRDTILIEVRDGMKNGR